MKISPLALAHMIAYTTAVVLGVVGPNLSVDAVSPSAAMRSPPSKLKTLLSKLNPPAIYPPAIGRDVAVSHPEKAETEGNLHGIVGQVERNLATRRLLINQDEAAKRVRDAVAAANQAVANRETSGVALPLDYVVLSEKYGGQQQLTVRLRLPGVDKDQNAMIDTGSSSLLFCDKDKSLINEAKNIKKTNYGQCIQYGSPQVTCPDNNSTGGDSALAGRIFQGDVGAYNDQGEEVASMDNASFAIAELRQNYACFGPLDGIIGVAYRSLNDAYELPSPDFNVSSLWNDFCQNPDQGQFSQGYKTVGNCALDSMTQLYLNPPLEQSLVQDDKSGEITSEAFGLYLDYAATIGSEVDTIVPSLGIYFGGNMAYDNQYYNDGKVQVAETVYDTDGASEWDLWYMMNFTSIRAPGFNLTQSTVDLCQNDGQCITDTGTSQIQLPLSQDDCDGLMSTGVDKLKELGSLFIDLTGADGNTITLSFPLLWLAEQKGLGYVSCTGPTGDFILGLPMTQYYYTVYDMGNKTVSFVELNLSNETKAFIDGPELGGASANAGFYNQAIGLSRLLAWTLLVPTAIAVITSL